MNNRLSAFFFIMLLVSCASDSSSKMFSRKPVTTFERVTSEYLNGTWNIFPKDQIQNALQADKGIFRVQTFSWGDGLMCQTQVAFDLQAGLLFYDSILFIQKITEVAENSFEICANYAIDHLPSEEERSNAINNPDMIFIVHFLDKDRFWHEPITDTGFRMDPKTTIYYRYSGPGTAVKENN